MEGGLELALAEMLQLRHLQAGTVPVGLRSLRKGALGWQWAGGDVRLTAWLQNLLLSNTEDQHITS